MVPSISYVLIMKNSKVEIKSIAFLRGVACSFVAFYHLKSSAPTDSIFYNLFKYGSFGVDLFFMISGFVIVIATLNDHSSLNFIIKRLFRIYPPLIAAVLFQIYFNNKGLSLVDFLKAITPLHNNYSAKSPDFGYSFLIVAWSISFELAFYLIFMFSMNISHKYRALICSIMILLTIIGSQLYFNGSASLLEAQYSPVISEHLNYLFPLRIVGCSIMIEFIVGMALAYVYMRVNIDNVGKYKKIFIFLSTLACMYLIPSYLGGYNRGTGLSGYGVWAILILFICLGLEKLRMVNWNPKVLFIGTISYSLYLFHIPVHEIVKAYNPNTFDQIKNIELRAVTNMLFEFTASVLIAWISFLVVERTSIKVARIIIDKITNRKTLISRN